MTEYIKSCKNLNYSPSCYFSHKPFLAIAHGIQIPAVKMHKQHKHNLLAHFWSSYTNTRETVKI